MSKSELKLKIPAIKFNANCDDLKSNTYTLLNVCLPISKEKSVLIKENENHKKIIVLNKYNFSVGYNFNTISGSYTLNTNTGVLSI